MATSPVPLLERVEQLTALERAWRSARAGTGSAWVVSAEPGGGKTRLITEFLEVARPRAFIGAAEPVAPPEPYLAICHALPGFEPDVRRVGSAQRAVDLLGEHAGGDAAVLFLDDLHFADEGTIAVFVRLAAEAWARRWLMLGAVRPGEGPPALHAALTESAAQGRLSRLDLPPLSCEGVAALLAGTRGAAIAEAEAAAIHRDSGGNPWLAEMLARGDGAVSLVRDRLQLRVDRLDEHIPGARRIVEALAPAGEPLPHPVVATICGGESPVLWRSLRRLRDAAVLVDDRGAWRFRHELLRHAVLDGMLTAHRAAAHLALAEALEASATDEAARARLAPALAMHYDSAGDTRAAMWAMRAARDAVAVESHAEALAQAERALRFAQASEERRAALQLASEATSILGRFAESRRHAEAGLTIPGGEPEERAHLHWLALRAASNTDDTQAPEAHAVAAERLLLSRPPSYVRAQVMLARAQLALTDLRHEQVAAAVQRALETAAAAAAPWSAAAEFEARRCLTVSALDAADPAAFAALESNIALAEAASLPAGHLVAALVEAYRAAVVSLFDAEAERLYLRATEAIRKYEFGWMPFVEPVRAMQLAQRGRYAEARQTLASTPPQEPGSPGYAGQRYAAILCEARAGSPQRAQELLDASHRVGLYRRVAPFDLAALELAMLQSPAELGERAQQLYGAANRRRFARLAGEAAVALARSGRGAPPPPAWLPEGAPPRVFWQWAEGIARRDSAVLRAASERLTALDLPYEAALARRDAGDPTEAYRMLRAIEAVTMREQLADELRTTGRPVPRRARAEIARDGLTDTEITVCRLVAAGARNDEIATRLDVSLRTVEAHLSRIYQKTAQRGRAALAAWWAGRG